MNNKNYLDKNGMVNLDEDDWGKLPLTNNGYLLSSGFFEIITKSHAKYLMRSKELAESLSLVHLIIINGGICTQAKYGRQPYVSETDRWEMLNELFPRSIVKIYAPTSPRTDLAQILSSNNIRGKTVGGPFKNSQGDCVIPQVEMDVCVINNIEIFFGVGGSQKITSSSEIASRIHSLYSLSMIASPNPNEV